MTTKNVFWQRQISSKMPCDMRTLCFDKGFLFQPSMLDGEFVSWPRSSLPIYHVIYDEFMTWQRSFLPTYHVTWGICIVTKVLSFNLSCGMGSLQCDKNPVFEPVLCDMRTVYCAKTLLFQPYHVTRGVCVWINPFFPLTMWHEDIVFW